MRVLIVLTIAFALGVISGCASTSKASDEKSTAAKDFVAPADKGVVYLYRRNRALGAGVQYQVKIDGS